MRPLSCTNNGDLPILCQHFRFSSNCFAWWILSWNNSLFFCRNGPVVSGGVNILNPSTAVVNPEHLDGEELLKHIRQIIQSSCIDDNIKVGGKN